MADLQNGGPESINLPFIQFPDNINNNVKVKVKNVKTSIYIARFMHKAPLMCIRH